MRSCLGSLSRVPNSSKGYAASLCCISRKYMGIRPIDRCSWPCHRGRTGQSLGAFMQERLWKPLNMVDTTFVIPSEKANRYARALSNDPNSGKPQPFPDRTRPSKMQCGGGCAASTASDYLRFVQMLLNHGKLDVRRVLGRKTVEYMLSDQLGPEIRASSVKAIRPALAMVSA